jgi:division protein CdvB (Snf7/Vps24/ESCRT-III family)
MARAMIREILRDQGDQMNLMRAVLEVTDERGDIVLEFPFSEALIAPPEEPPTTH